MNANRFWRKVQIGDALACWEWNGERWPLGYGVSHRDGRRIGAHRQAWIIANGPIPEGLVVCHRCDNPPCCNPAHLFLGTKGDNTRDAMEKGRFKPYNDRTRVLTDDDLAEIRRTLAQKPWIFGGVGARDAELAAEYGVRPATIACVRLGLTHRSTGEPVHPNRRSRQREKLMS